MQNEKYTIVYSSYKRDKANYYQLKLNDKF